MHRFVLVFVLLLSGPAFAQGLPDMPQWWHDHIDFITRDGGTWVTDNPDVTDDPNSPDQFGMEWWSVNYDTQLRGRLYGLRDGEVIGEYWTFAEFWHPGEQKVVIEQWSLIGGYGVGETRRLDESRGESEQTFWTTSGEVTRSGHRTFENGDRYENETYSIDEDGNWTLTGGFDWDRVPPSDEG